jgi:hypothetical protein
MKITARPVIPHCHLSLPCTPSVPLGVAPEKLAIRILAFSVPKDRNQIELIR